ncbi:hypothetical protein PHISCL_07176 [Aspergillus sclerotialis]|uniref:Uncharacterized protein n=1 Tax=Aspergillus sclerotialis TaxID=2070753 RepID=A0A3A2ZM95_9EURO|nr:hypothetical protein PHISCL_07176 [Aspergillus sclerotialis]
MSEAYMSLPATVPFFHLNHYHAQLLREIFHRTLATKLAEDSFAMLLDGRLTLDALMECRRLGLNDDFDDILNYSGPTEESITMFRSLRDQFDPSHVSIKASSAEKFKRSATQPPCKDFKHSLLDLVASMIHDLAISIFEGLHGSRYQNKPHEGPENPVHPDFRHPKYVHSRLYPRGPIELVGYWIEMRLFGGVIVFEHGNPPGEPGSPWVHFPYEGIMKLSNRQLDAFTQFAFAEPPMSDSTAVRDVLPFTVEEDAHTVESRDAYELGLFRNSFEHVPPPNISRWECVKRNVTYPDWILEELRRSCFWHYTHCM